MARGCKTRHMTRVVACNAVTAGSTVGSITHMRGLPLTRSGHLTGLIPSGVPSVGGFGLGSTVGCIPRLGRTTAKGSPLTHSALGCTRVLRNGIHGANMRTYNIVVKHCSVSSIMPIDATGSGSANRRVLIARCRNSIVRRANLVGVSFLKLGALSVVGRTVRGVQLAANRSLSVSRVDLRSPTACGLCYSKGAANAFRFRSTNVRGCLGRLRPSGFRSLVTVGTLCHPKPVSCVPSFVTHGRKGRRVGCSVPIVRQCLGSACNVAICRRRIVLLSHLLTGFAHNRDSTLHGTVNGGLVRGVGRLGSGFVTNKGAGNCGRRALRGV